MAKYSEELREKVATLIEVDFFSVSQVCKALGISRQIFYSWINDKPDFKTRIEEAMSIKNETLLSMAYSSIKRRLENGMSVEEKDTYVPDKEDPEKLIFKSRIIKRKEYLPDLRTIKMVLNRNDRLQVNPCLNKKE